MKFKEIFCIYKRLDVVEIYVYLYMFLCENLKSTSGATLVIAIVIRKFQNKKYIITITAFLLPRFVRSVALFKTKISLRTTI